VGRSAGLTGRWWSMAAWCIYAALLLIEGGLVHPPRCS